MYRPPAFREDRLETLYALMREHPLATLVTAGPQGLLASHAPLGLDPARGPKGTLIGHLSRANEQWRELETAGQALAVFQGPEAYVSPSYYASKREHGRVVPTWNYVAVHAWGRVRVFDDPAGLRSVVERLTNQHERGRPQPWQVDDAPAEYIEGALKAIVGFELEIERLEGQWKLSQNRSAEDRQGVRRGLAEESASGTGLAALIPE